MDLRFVSPDLRRLDETGMEVIACGLFADERPPRGALAMIDWRLAGRISVLIEKGWVTGAAGEVVMVPVRPKLPFDKALLFGMGKQASFDEAAYRGLVERMLGVMEGLSARNAVVELPGRHSGLIGAELAAAVLVELAAGRTEHDAWTLIESSEDQKKVAAQMIEQRRRVMRVALS